MAIAIGRRVGQDRGVAAGVGAVQRFDGRVLRDAALLAVTTSAVACSEAFDHARAVISDGAPRPTALIAAWLVLTLISAAAGACLARRVLAVALAADIPHRRSRDGTPLPGLAGWLWSALAAWLAWQAVGLAVVAGADVSSWVLAPVHLLAAALAIAAASAAAAVTGDFSTGWQRATVVRVQLVFLAVLFALVLFAPFTAAQLSDVLRAWGDGPVARPIAGIAAALLLGAVCRGSAARLLCAKPGTLAEGLPHPPGWLADATAALKRRLMIRRSGVRAGSQENAPSGAPPRNVGAWVTAGIVGTAALSALRLFPLVALFAGAAILMAATQPVSPTEPNSEKRTALLRLAGTLGVVPVGILLIGLVGATAGSFLLPAPRGASDWLLVGLTLAVVVAFWLLCAAAQVPASASAERRGTRVPGWALLAVGLLCGAAARFSPTVAALGLILVAALLAARALGDRGAHELWAAWGLGMGTAFTVLCDPVAGPRGVGTFAVALVGATAMLAVLHVAGAVALRRRQRRRDRSAPVLAVVAAWVAAALVSLLLAESHNARTEPTKRESLALPTAVGRWLDRQRPASDGRIPMLLVAASGGGSKAAYWTDLVLDCLFGDGEVRADAAGCGKDPNANRRAGRLLLTSSVSGGSVGVLHLLRDRGDPGNGSGWVGRAAGGDVLSPLVAWGIFHDLPLALIGANTNPDNCADVFDCGVDADRAVVQERAVAAGDASPVDDRGVLGRGPPYPLFNASRFAGFPPKPLRVVLSPLDLSTGPCDATRALPLTSGSDGLDSLEGADVPLGTAALLSARFPLLAPPGRLGSGGHCHPPRRLRDGGLFENTGLETIVDLLPALRKAAAGWKARGTTRAGADVLPVVVSIDDDVPGIRADDAYDRGLLGALGFGASRERSTEARRELKDACRRGELLYARISPRPHVGAQAATGWELSQTSRSRDLAESLGADDQARILARLQAVLDGGNESSTAYQALVAGCAKSP
jgi:hypothetical protein